MSCGRFFLRMSVRGFCFYLLLFSALLFCFFCDALVVLDAGLVCVEGSVVDGTDAEPACAAAENVPVDAGVVYLSGGGSFGNAGLKVSFFPEGASHR